MVRRVATNTRLKLTHSDSGIYKVLILWCARRDLHLLVALLW